MGKEQTVIGLYGIPGSGKSYALSTLKETLGSDGFSYYEGADVISAIAPGGLSGFKCLTDNEKARCRGAAIRRVEQSCVDGHTTAVVTGHCMFWSEDSCEPVSVMTKEDLRVYTHIIYLLPKAEVVYMQCLQDTTRTRPQRSLQEILQWQQAEQLMLSQRCAENGILLVHVRDYHTMPEKLRGLVQDFATHTQQLNLHRAEKDLDHIFEISTVPSATIVLDADKTISAADTGKAFWQHCSTANAGLQSFSLEELFGGPLGYSYSAFRQASLWYEEAATALDFSAVCKDIASSVTLQPQFETFLQHVARIENVLVVVITCGLSTVWKEVLGAANIAKPVHVIGGCRLDHGYVVTPEVKAALVRRLQRIHRQVVYAFGDSPLDIDMLQAACKAYIVVGEEHSRSKSMDTILPSTVSLGCALQQILLPSYVSPRMSPVEIPVTTLPAVADELRAASRPLQTRRILHGTGASATKLLMTPTRDASIAGPALRQAFRAIGRHIAVNYLPTIVQLEAYDIPHVQGKQTEGYRLLDETRVTLVALMRGGEPVASGINEIFPAASFVHAKRPEDLLRDHLQGQALVLLVDTVVNEGHTMAAFVDRVRALADIRIILVAAVVQDMTLHSGGVIDSVLSKRQNVDLITLRISLNKYKGSGGNDTSNRLFNTTMLL